MLAISLHAVRDDLRNTLVPLNKKYPIRELLDACRNYPGVSNARRITFEYVMLKGVNDSLADARELVRLLKGIPEQDQPDPVQPLARHAVRMLGLGADRGVLRDRFPRRLRLPGPHAARPRHPRRLRPAEKRNRKTPRPRQTDAGKRNRAGRPVRLVGGLDAADVRRGGRIGPGNGCRPRVPGGRRAHRAGNARASGRCLAGRHPGAVLGPCRVGCPGPGLVGGRARVLDPGSRADRPSAPRGRHCRGSRRIALLRLVWRLRGRSDGRDRVAWATPRRMVQIPRKPSSCFYSSSPAPSPGLVYWAIAGRGAGEVSAPAKA